MSSKLRNICCRMVLICAMVLILPFQSFAAAARISFSDPSAKAGSEVSVTMKFSSTDGSVLGNTDVMLAYDAEMLEYINETENASGGAGAIRVWTGAEGKTEMVTKLRFLALKPGTSTITITSWEGYDNDGNSLTEVKEGSSRITTEALEMSSNDAKLMSLRVSPGTLEPGFSPDTENYTVTVGLDVAKLTVSANPNNSKANVAVEGASELQAGDNQVVCRVTAEDGTTVKNYTITVKKVEGGAAESEPSSEGENDAPKQELEVLAELDVTAKKIRITGLPEGVEVPSYLKESSIAIGDVKVQGWTSSAEEKPSYCVFYGMNEAGEAGFYRYDLKEKTVQRCMEGETGAVTQQQYDAVVTEHDKIVDDYNRMMILTAALGILSAVLIVVLVVVLRSRRSVRQDSFMEPAPRREAKPVRSPQGRKMSKEERYMMGVEDEYDEEEDQLEEYLPEPASQKQSAKKAAAVRTAKPEALMMRQAAVQQAVSRIPEPESDDFDEEEDFEFFDLDDE